MRSGQQASPWEGKDKKENVPYGDACTFPMRRNMKRVPSVGIVESWVSVGLHWSIAAAVDTVRAVMGGIYSWFAEGCPYRARCGRLEFEGV